MKVSRGGKAFKMKRPWKKYGDTREDDELQDPEVYFAIAFSSDEAPDDVVNMICCEWGHMNGKKLWLKSITSFQTETHIAIYHMLNLGHQKMIAVELTKILESAHELEAEVELDYVHEGVPIPEFTFRLNVPKIPNQDTSVFQNWPKILRWGPLLGM